MSTHLREGERFAVMVAPGEGDRKGKVDLCAEIGRTGFWLFGARPQTCALGPSQRDPNAQVVENGPNLCE